MKKFISVLAVVVMLFALALPVAAEISPEEPGPSYDVDADVKEGEGKTSTVDNEDGTVTIIAEPDEGHKFIKWDLEGEYTLVSGTLTDKVITIKPLSDVKAWASFDGDKVVVTPDDDEKSPTTGVIEPAFIAVVMIISAAGAAYAFKKSGSKA